MISLDGFRYEYFTDDSISDYRVNLDQLAAKGILTPMTPIFPTVTFPNHWSIVTGLYSESHGIIENDMYDPHFNEYYSIFDETVNDPKWYGGEALWETYQNAGGVR